MSGWWYQGRRHLQLSDIDLDRNAGVHRGTPRSWDELRRDPDWRKDARFLDRLYTFLDRIPALERDVIELYFYKGKRQETIARMLHLSQQTVSHRMYSAFRRIIFMMEQPEVTPTRMRVDLKAMLPNPFTVQVLCDFALTSSQTTTAKNLGVIQQRVYRHLNAAMRRLRKHITLDSLFYVSYFERLMEHRNILCEVPGPRRKIDARVEAECARYARRLLAYERGRTAKANRQAKQSRNRSATRGRIPAYFGAGAEKTELQSAGAA